MIVTQHGAKMVWSSPCQARVQVWRWRKCYRRSMVSFLLDMTSSRETANKEKWKRENICLFKSRDSSGARRTWNAEEPDQVPVFVHVKCWSSMTGWRQFSSLYANTRICCFWFKSAQIKCENVSLPKTLLDFELISLLNAHSRIPDGHVEGMKDKERCIHATSAFRLRASKTNNFVLLDQESPSYPRFSPPCSSDKVRLSTVAVPAGFRIPYNIVELASSLSPTKTVQRVPLHTMMYSPQSMPAMKTGCCKVEKKKMATR